MRRGSSVGRRTRSHVRHQTRSSRCFWLILSLEKPPTGDEGISWARASRETRMLLDNTVSQAAFCASLLDRGAKGCAMKNFRRTQQQETREEYSSVVRKQTFKHFSGMDCGNLSHFPSRSCLMLLCQSITRNALSAAGEIFSR